MMRTCQIVTATVCHYNPFFGGTPFIVMLYNRLEYLFVVTVFRRADTEFPPKGPAKIGA